MCAQILDKSRQAGREALVNKTRYKTEDPFSTNYHSLHVEIFNCLKGLGMDYVISIPTLRKSAIHLQGH
jgi:hypothetical protein